MRKRKSVALTLIISQRLFTNNSRVLNLSARGKCVERLHIGEGRNERLLSLTLDTIPDGEYLLCVSVFAVLADLLGRLTSILNCCSVNSGVRHLLVLDSVILIWKGILCGKL